MSLPRTTKVISILIVALVWIANICTGLVHDLSIVDDDRSLFKIETFGFFAGGEMHINVKDFKLDGHVPGVKPMKIGFLMRKADTESAAQEDLEKALEEGACLLEQLHPNDVFLDLSKTSQVNMKVETGADGLYSFIFARCDPSGHHTVSFKMHADFHNPGPNYLSAGDSALPLVYFVFFLLFTMALLVWIWVLCRPSSSHVTVLSIHYLMGALLVVKCACLLVESIRFHFISLTGASATWSIVYYVVTSLRGVMLFTVILLIGSGWSLLKQYLNDREKKIILVVLTMQVFDNVAMVVLEETAPGSQGWLTWRDLLHLVDVMCCCAILFPIVWSIKHLRQAAEVDGKAQMNLAKLQLFRQFYVMVVAYIYFTRIVVFLIEATIPFYMLWMGALFTELATFAFYVITGYKFRPASDNPYLPVNTEDTLGLLNEYGDLDHATSLELQSHVNSIT